MAIEIERLGYVGIGILAKMQDVLENFIEGKDEEEDEGETVEEREKMSLRERFEELADLGEERYEEWIDKGKDGREKFADKIRERANKVFSELGLVTKEDLEELEAKITKLQRAIKKAVSSK
ncbi:MAG: phasin family protein [bacterium]